jgi:prolyl 4-hydroxylase
MEYVYEARDVIPKSLCDEIIDKFENDPDTDDGRINKGIVNHTVKKSTDLSIYLRPSWKRINDQIERYLFNGIREYFDNLLYRVYHGNSTILAQLFGDNINITNFQIQRYKENEYFNWHMDDRFGEKRLLAFIIYLNDNEAGTEFLNYKNIKPEVGKILFFPSTWTYTHRGQTVEKGVKYILTGFICEYI